MRDEGDDQDDEDDEDGEGDEDDEDDEGDEDKTYLVDDNDDSTIIIIFMMDCCSLTFYWCRLLKISKFYGILRHGKIQACTFIFNDTTLP